MKGKFGAFSCHKLQSSVWLVYLEFKQHQHRCGSCIWKLKVLKKQQSKVFRIKQLSSKVSLLFLDVKLHRKRYDRRFQTLQTNPKSTADVFGAFITQNQP